ncbi:MAG: pentapeptide repeat-containing protein, partial [Planctomycetes bacterium]|nr:pentapeptide repeat-containing protein [Planctomycetota bacterium]
MTNSTLQRTNFSGAILAHAKLNSATMQGVDLSKAVLKQCDFTEAKLQSANLTGAQGDCNLSSAQLGEATLTHVSLDGGRFDGAYLRKARVDRASLQRVSMKHANLNNAVLCGTDFSGADISGTTFEQADLSGADLTDVIVNSHTSFENAKVDGCKIARHTLECLKDYGGLTPGQRMVMNIGDDVARLRASYSGFQQWVHLTAVTVFVFPYAWFLIKSWAHAKFSPTDGESTITLFFALIRFIWNGGQNLRDGPSFNLYAVTLFVFALTYNSVRAWLLWKTKRLELAQ